ncbi:MAG: hypothetical protein ABIL39_11510 [candidate division WOR-3 bacterium]
MKKNVANQVVSAHLINKTDGSDVTSGTTTVYVTIDGGTQGTGSGTVTHKGNGEWVYQPTQSETNGDHIIFTFVNSNAISVGVQVYTDYPQTGDAYAIVSNATYGNSALNDDVDTLLSRLTSTRAGYLDNLPNLDTSISSRAPASTALSNTVWTDTKAGYLDASISSRSTLTAQQVWEYTTRTLTSFGSLVSDIFDYAVEGSLKLVHVLRIMLSALALKSSGGGTNTIYFRNVADDKNRISATVDGNGNRTSVTLDGT